ncbi:Cof-type HAD-IIB family hydrolase [Enterococcus sp. HY326]|uniref:Cof-type HAD-IIB family hydrolase n=1 Tax=Enterococcus sp. HY326 TaxID=2971265 RepID=UPI0022406A9A|nr:Cof-type HAD-IIB family hydrolase [Enterococcus sp. HY326]
MIKAIFFDIDGTLVGSDSQADATTKAAIAEARKKGILCGIATGRSPVKISEMIDFIELDVFVTYNGQLVYTPEQDIYKNPFSKQVLNEIVDYADGHNRQILFGARNRLDGSRTVSFGNSVFAKSLTKFVPKNLTSKVLKFGLQKLRKARKKKSYHRLSILNEPIYQCIMLSSESGDHLLRERLPHCDFQRSNQFSVDVTPKGGSKLHGIEAFIQLHDIKLSEVMAFGDNLNDIDMLTHVGYGVAMGNGRQEVKEIADFVTHSNESDGIAFAMKHYGVIE